jgi:enolase-phosphatase E1
VTIRLAARGLGAVLLDIEGTTTPIAFVHEVLFPYARRRLPTYLDSRRSSPELADIIRRLVAERAADERAGLNPPGLSEDAAGDPARDLPPYVIWLMDRDRKSPGLKLLQGQIWEEGYQAGELRGQVFSDVPGAIRRWRDQGVDVAIYSSGSVLAQRRLFESTADGDLVPLLSGFFDTSVGAKISSSSYEQIARALARLPQDVLFVSDVTAELRAARQAGLQVVLSLRPGNAPQADAGEYERIETFEEIL